MKNLLGYVSKIVNSIFQSIDRCPKSMRVIFGFLQEEVGKQFPNDPQIKYSAVSGFIFLRFLSFHFFKPFFFPTNSFFFFFFIEKIFLSWSTWTKTLSTS